MHNVDDLINIFAQCFEQKYRTKLVQGTDEPLYLPAKNLKDYHQIIFAHGFFSSALHECAHWLLAGKARRQQLDYGYWYVPDGRNKTQQALFQQVEIKPQALEWILSDACGYKFQFSSDNLNGDLGDEESFKQNVLRQKLIYAEDGLLLRARVFVGCLSEFYTCFK